MNTMSSRSMVTFSNAFVLSGYTDELPPGEYEVIAEDELLEGVSFAAFRRMATYLMVRPRGRGAGRTEMRPITAQDLETALSRDRALSDSITDGVAAHSPPEEMR